jgi:hypothetical protein
MANMLSRTTTFLASVIVIANFTACSTPYSDVYSFKKNKFQAPVEKKTEIVVPAAALNPLEGTTAPALDPALRPHRAFRAFLPKQRQALRFRPNPLLGQLPWRPRRVRRQPRLQFRHRALRPFPVCKPRHRALDSSDPR